MFLREKHPALVEDVPLNVRARMWFQHDRAPAHFGATARQCFDYAFPHRWIGRGGPIAWPARSPDLNSIDFFLWGYVKALVYDTPVQNEETLLARILAACEMIRTFERMRQNLLRRCHACIASQGRYFKHLL